LAYRVGILGYVVRAQPQKSPQTCSFAAWGAKPTLARHPLPRHRSSLSICGGVKYFDMFLLFHFFVCAALF
jgi:hypothetical protein